MTDELLYGCHPSKRYFVSLCTNCVGKLFVKEYNLLMGKEECIQERRSGMKPCFTYLYSSYYKV